MNKKETALWEHKLNIKAFRDRLKNENCRRYSLPPNIHPTHILSSISLTKINKKHPQRFFQNKGWKAFTKREAGRREVPPGLSRGWQAALSSHRSEGRKGCCPSQNLAEAAEASCLALLALCGSELRGHDWTCTWSPQQPHEQVHGSPASWHSLHFNHVFAICLWESAQSNHSTPGRGQQSISDARWNCNAICTSLVPEF